MKSVSVALFVLAAILFTGAGAGAQTFGNTLAGMAAVDLVIEDAVSDNCWPDPAGTRQRMERQLAGAGISVTANSKTLLTLELIGFEVEDKPGSKTGRCVISYFLSLEDCARYRSSFSPRARFGCYGLWSSSGVSSFQKADAHRVANDAALKLTGKFLGDLRMDRLGKAPRN